MKKTKMLPLIFVLLFLVVSTFVLIKANAATAKTAVTAASLSSLDDVQVDQVNHFIKILDGGSVAINDTIALSAKAGKSGTLSNYSLGFPYRYRYQLAQVFAFNTSNPSQFFNVSLDTSVNNALGYYGVTVTFSHDGAQLPLRFTVVFVFSNIISSSTTYDDEQKKTVPVFTLDFPIHPSLLQNASSCNVTVFCPPKTVFTESSYSVPFNVKLDENGGQIVVFESRPLTKLTSTMGWLNFTSSDNTYRVATVNQLKRQISINELGNLQVTEDYTVTSGMQQLLTGMRLYLMQGAYNVSAADASGKALSAPAFDQKLGTYTISFDTSLNRGESIKFTLNYGLPTANYLSETGLGNYELTFSTTKDLRRVIGTLIVSVSLPEGASIKEFTAPNIQDYGLNKGALQEEVVFTAYNASLYDNLDFQMTYTYSLFWASLRPTLWVTVIVGIACAVALVWRSPKPAAPTPLPGIGARPQTFTAIVSSYEEKRKILAELDSLEKQAQRGRIPRRRYKVRRQMLESQLSRLNRELVDIKRKVKSAGPKYVDIIKDLEISEAELEGIEQEFKRIEARYRRGELSLEGYKRLLDQYSKRKEKAKTVMDAALLRLSEGVA
jgi:hypothetical protein